MITQHIRLPLIGPAMMNHRALTVAAGVGTVAQVAMVVGGHRNPSVAARFAVGGMGISLIAGVIYAWLARGEARPVSALAAGGAVAGGACAFIGILVSHLLGDVPMSLLLLGTISSVVTGAIGGALGKLFAARTGVAATVLVVVLLPLLAARADAQPTVTTRDFAWLAGRWEGTMASGAVGVADVTFTTPVGGLITGVMRLVANEKVLVVELISLTDTPDGPELRFRHFSNTLEAYEPTFKQSMRLTAHEAHTDTFENSVPYEKTLMSTQPRVTVFQRHDADAFTGRTNIIDDEGKLSVVEVRYRRVASR